MVENTEKGNISPLITIRLAFHGEYIPAHLNDELVEETKSGSNQTSEPVSAKLPSDDLFEFFTGVDITKTTLHTLITELHNKRDFSENGIKKMIMQSGV